MSGRDRNRSTDMGPDKTDSDWRARPSGDVDEGPRRDDSYGEREQFYLIRQISSVLDVYNCTLVQTVRNRTICNFSCCHYC